MRHTVSSTLRNAGGLALLALASLALVAGCDAKGKRSYRLGVVLDEDGMRGALLAAEQINSQGGINGHPLELRSGGDAGSTRAQIALETAERLAADPTLLGVVGHTNSSASLAASQVYNARRIVQIAPTSSTPIYSDAGPYSFRLVGSDLYQGAFLAAQVLARSPRPRVAMLYVNDDYGRPLRGIVLERLRAGGAVPVYDSPYSEGLETAGDSEMVTAMDRARPDLLVWIGRAREYIRIRPLLQAKLPHLVVIASDGISGGTVARDTARVLGGVSYVRMVDPDRQDSMLVRMRERFKSESLGEPGDQAILSYDAVMLLAEAIRRAGPQRQAIRDWLWQVGKRSSPFMGLSGPIAFPTGGDRRSVYVLQKAGRAPMPSGAAPRP